MSIHRSVYTGPVIIVHQKNARDWWNEFSNKHGKALTAIAPNVAMKDSLLWLRPNLHEGKGVYWYNIDCDGDSDQAIFWSDHKTLWPGEMSAKLFLSQAYGPTIVKVCDEVEKTEVIVVTVLEIR